MKELISINELIDQSWALYKSSFSFFLQVSGWLLPIALLNTIAVLFFPSSGSIATHTIFTTTEISGALLYGATNIIIAPILGFWVFLSLVIAAQSRLNNDPKNIALIMRETKRRFLPTVIVVILVGLTLLLAQIMSFGPALVMGAFGFLLEQTWLLGLANILLILGIFVSLVLTSKWSIAYIMAPYAAALNDQKTLTALRKSESMTKDRFWDVLVRIFIPKFVFLLFGIFLAYSCNILIQSLLTGAAGFNTETYTRLNNLVLVILPVIIAILFDPLIFISDVLLFRSLKNSQE